jgi:Uma2 family endonuclease
MATITRALSPDALKELDQSGLRYEIVGGDVHVSPAGLQHGDLNVRLTVKLALFVQQHRLGHVFDSSTGFRMPGGNLRAPDVCFVAQGRLPAGRLPKGFGELAPDLVVEVLSPDASPREVLDKVGEYLSAGARMIWIIDPKTESAVVYRSLTQIGQVTKDGALDGEDLLPGFTLPLAELFD